VLWLDYLAVDPACQGQGIGRLLMRDCEAAAAAAGLSRIELAAYTVNDRAIEFYKLLGYKVTSVAESEGRVGLTKDLTAGGQPDLKNAFLPTTSWLYRSSRTIAARLILELDELCRMRSDTPDIVQPEGTEHGVGSAAIKLSGAQ
jgi:hypothetical protein